MVGGGEGKFHTTRLTRFLFSPTGMAFELGGWGMQNLVHQKLVFFRVGKLDACRGSFANLMVVGTVQFGNVWNVHNFEQFYARVPSSYNVFK